MIVQFALLSLISISDGARIPAPELRPLPPQGFGSYVMSIRMILECSLENPDTEHLPYNTTLKTERFNRTDQFLILNYTYPKDFCLSHVYLEFRAERRGGIFDVEFKRTTDKPCENFIFGPLMKKGLQPDENCCCKKGTHFMKINPNEITHESFPHVQYNAYILDMRWYTKIGQLGCIKYILDIKPAPRKIKPKIG